MNYTVTLNISETELDILKTLFKNEPNFQPQTNEDRVLVELIRDIVDHARPEEPSKELFGANVL